MKLGLIIWNKSNYLDMSLDIVLKNGKNLGLKMYECSSQIGQLLTMAR